MEWVFEIEDITGRKIYLSRERWSHITQDHQEVSPYIEDMKEALHNPTKITEQDFKVKVGYYYKYLKVRPSPAKYLLIIVKYLNGRGFIITAYFVRRIK